MKGMWGLVGLVSVGARYAHTRFTRHFTVLGGGGKLAV
jgi:hypothetical protein